MAKSYSGKISWQNKKIGTNLLVATIFIFCTLYVYADGWVSSEPYHQTLYADTITSRSDASSVNVADAQGLFVTGDIKTLGNLGIGTLTPTQTLDVAGQIHSTGDICTDASGGLCLSTVSGSITSYWNSSGSDIFSTNSGNLGIGTASPSEKLHVSGNVLATGTVCDSNGCIGSLGNSGWIDDGAIVRLTTASDKVGINTASPGSELEINGQLKITSEIGDKLVLAGSQAGPHTIYLDNSKGIRFWDNVNNELVRITNTGNMGIGTTSPGYKLDVTGDVRWSGTLQGGSVPWAQITGAPAFITDGNTNWDNSYDYITSNIGGSTMTAARFTDGNDGNYYADPASTSYFNTIYASVYLHSSDKILKTNIMQVKGLEIINELKGVSFNWKESGITSAGVIAQDVEKVFPEAVSTDNKTGFKSVNYAAMTAPIIESINDLSQENVQNKKRIAELENKTNVLEKEISELKKKLYELDEK